MVNSRGYTFLVYGGYTFNPNKRSTNTFWVCSDYIRSKCKCRCITTPDGKLKPPRFEHNHPPNIDRIKESRFKVKYVMTPEEFFEQNKTIV